MSDSALERSRLIAERLKESRRLSGLSQKQVAKQMNVHRPTISDIESGKRKVSAEELLEFCDIYDVNIDWVVGKSEPTLDSKDPRLGLAARELKKMKADDLDRLLRVIAAIRVDSDS